MKVEIDLDRRRAYRTGCMMGELRRLKRDLYSGEGMAPISCSKPSASLLNPVPLPVLSQLHSTEPSSPKRYDKRYEAQRRKSFREFLF
jgi:hypothetical protein